MRQNGISKETVVNLSKEDIWRLKFECDEVSSAALERIQEIYARKQEDGEPKARLDMYRVLADHHTEDDALGRLWDDLNTVPDWVDWAQIARGQHVFYRYGLANLIGFALQGFMGENAATPGIAEVLVRTGGFATKVVLRRALETFQWLLQVTRNIDDIKPGGDGHVSTGRIRLLHASVRQRILCIRETSPEYFDVEKFGLPINRLDDIHSIALFSCNPMFLQLPLMGIQPTPAEIEDYIALFRYLGHLLAVPDHYFSSAAQGRATMDAMCRFERRPTDTSKILCYNFIKALEDKPPYRISTGFIEAGARTINGHEMSDAEGLGRPGIISYAAFWGFCWLCQFLAFVQRRVPSFDKYLIRVQGEQFYVHMIEGSNSLFSLGGPSSFPMKYDPQVGKLTKKDAGIKSEEDKFLIRPLESLFIAVFVLGCAIVSFPTLASMLFLYRLCQQYALL